MRLKDIYLSKRHDYHAHTKFSDGTHTINESIEARLMYAEVIGISDHYRYLIAQSHKLEIYCNEIREAAMLYNESTKGRNTVKLGLEIFLADIPYAINNLISYPFEYIIIENFEYFMDQGEVLKTFQMLVDVMRIHAQPVEFILAHPNFEVWFGHLSREGGVGIEPMLSFLKSHGFALELNVNTGYFFMKGDVCEALEDWTDPVVNTLKSNAVELSIGTDSHDYAQALFTGFDRAYTFFERSARDEANTLLR